MSINFNVSEIQFKGYHANEAMKRVVSGLNSDTLRTIEIIDFNSINKNREDVEWVNTIKDMDVIVPGDIKLLNTAGIDDKKLAKEVNASAFIKMFLKYMYKHDKKIFVIAHTSEDLEAAKIKIEKYSGDSSTHGMSVLELTGRSEDEIINEINAIEPDCILSVLSSPKQEEFIRSNKAYINAGIWLGCGNVFGKYSASSIKHNLLSFFKKDKNNM